MLYKSIHSNSAKITELEQGMYNKDLAIWKLFTVSAANIRKWQFYADQ